MKKHPFFKEIDWQKLMKRQIDPPVHLKLDDQGDSEEAKMFAAIEKKQGVLLNDKDYTEANQKHNRVINFTFVSNR